MSKVRLEFEENFPESEKARLKKLLNKTKWMTPSWLQVIRINWDRRNIKSYVTCQANSDYRWVYLTICPAFLTESDENATEHLYHEFFHSFIEPLTRFTEEVIEMAFNEKTDKLMYNKLHRDLESLEEKAVQDMSFIVAEKMKGV